MMLVSNTRSVTSRRLHRSFDWQQFQRKATVVFFLRVTFFYLVCLWRSFQGVVLMKTSSSYFMKRHKCYLSDACCMTCRHGGMGQLISCRGRGMTGALLQLVPQLGHLGAEWSDKCFSIIFFKEGRGYSLFPSQDVNLAFCQWEGPKKSAWVLKYWKIYLPQVISTPPRCWALVSAPTSPSSGLLSPGAWSL